MFSDQVKKCYDMLTWLIYSSFLFVTFVCVCVCVSVLFCLCHPLYTSVASELAAFWLSLCTLGDVVVSHSLTLSTSQLDPLPCVQIPP